MNNLQHERITILAQDLRLTALPDLYGGIAQNAANKKDVSYADFLEDVLKAERDARRVRSRVRYRSRSAKISKFVGAGAWRKAHATELTVRSGYPSKLAP